MPGDPAETAYTAVDIAFTKLFASIIHSTVWREEMHVKVVWITMLAMANPRGEVIASVPGLADAARVSLPQCVEALEKLSAPDPWSRTKRHEGRRIQTFEGGWLILTYLEHRNRRNADERRLQTREAVRRYRERKAEALTVSNVSNGKQCKPGKAQAEEEAEAEGEAETTKSKALVAPKSGATGQAIMTEFQQLLTTQHLNGAARTAKAKLVFAYWAAKWDHPSAVYDGKRRSRLEARLKENGDNVSELLWVIDGAKRDEWTDRGKYAGIEQLFRDRGAVERLAGMAPGFRNGESHPMAVKYAGVPEKPDAVG